MNRTRSIALHTSSLLVFHDLNYRTNSSYRNPTCSVLVLQSHSHYRTPLPLHTVFYPHPLAVYSLLEKGFRMDQPPGCPPNVYMLMLQWSVPTIFAKYLHYGSVLKRQWTMIDMLLWWADMNSSIMIISWNITVRCEIWPYALVRGFDLRCWLSLGSTVNVPFITSCPRVALSLIAETAKNLVEFAIFRLFPAEIVVNMMLLST